MSKKHPHILKIASRISAPHVYLGKVVRRAVIESDDIIIHMFQPLFILILFRCSLFVTIYSKIILSYNIFNQFLFFFVDY